MGSLNSKFQMGSLNWKFQMGRLNWKLQMGSLNWKLHMVSFDSKFQRGSLDSKFNIGSFETPFMRSRDTTLFESRVTWSVSLFKQTEKNDLPCNSSIHILIVIILFRLAWQQTEYRSVSNQSEKCTYNQNLYWFAKRDRCVYHSLLRQCHLECSYVTCTAVTSLVLQLHHLCCSYKQTFIVRHMKMMH